jgi:alpha-amylase
MRLCYFMTSSLFVLFTLLASPIDLVRHHKFVGDTTTSGKLFDDCWNWNGFDACRGQQTNVSDISELRRWQTPPKGSLEWQPSFQYYNTLVGYARILYNYNRSAARVIVVAMSKNSSVVLMYVFDSQPPKRENYLDVSQERQTPLSITIVGSDGSSLKLDEVYFVWQNVPIKQDSNKFENGQKGAIIELFGWPYKDIALECEAIGKMGYLGVKVYPPQESVLSFDQLQNNELNPWWFIYQPVSYRLFGRAGTRQELRNMINTCRKFGVRVYADAVINHMSGNGNDMGIHRIQQGGYCAYWGAKNSTGGSPYYTQGFAFKNNTWTNAHPIQEYPAVPYGPLHFHCERPLNSWNDPFILNYGWLDGLTDLNTEHPYVQQRIADYFTDLISIGFSGFRVDAAKHVSPDDLAAIFGRFKKNLGGSDFPEDFIAYLEILLGGEKDLLMCQYNWYQYSDYFTQAMKRQGLTPDDIYKIKIWSSDYPKEFPICGFWIIPSERLVIENDCVDDQKPGSSSRDMGDKGSVLVLQKDVAKHRGFETLLFSRTDGNWKIRLVLSSYTLRPDTRGDDGWPDGLSDCSRNCKGPYCKDCVGTPYTSAHNPNVCGYTVFDSSGNWIAGQYTRVHRDKAIIMAMRQWMGLPTNVTNEEIGLPAHCT